MATAVNALVVALVPPARRDERLRKELTEDALHILNRSVPYTLAASLLNPSSHIGTSRQVDVGHISANIRAKCTLSNPLFSF
jgi:hypothetical protein